MDNMELGRERPSANAVKELSPDEFEKRVRKTAAETGSNVTMEHMDVILTLIDHHQESYQKSDCHAATPNMLMPR